MRDIAVELAHRPGALAGVAAILAQHNVRLKAGAALAIGHRVIARFIPDDIVAARAALDSANVGFREAEIVAAVLESRAGELAMLSRRLADGGVNLRAIYITGTTDRLVELAIVPDNVNAARRALE